jgi:hypothetical protein
MKFSGQKELCHVSILQVSPIDLVPGPFLGIADTNIFRFATSAFTVFFTKDKISLSRTDTSYHERTRLPLVRLLRQMAIRSIQPLRIGHESRV